MVSTSLQPVDNVGDLLGFYTAIAHSSDTPGKNLVAELVFVFSEF